MGNKPYIFLIGLLVFSPLQAVLARDYAIEVIIFERPETTKEPAEHWDYSLERIAGKLETLQTLASKSVEFETSPELENLDSIKQNLVAAGYRVLRTAKWVQPALLYQHAPVIDLGVENSTLPNGFVRVYKTSLIYADINLHLVPFSLLPFTSIPLGIQQVDDSISSQANTGNSITSGNTLDSSSHNEPYQKPQYFLSEKRRLKFKEIHYFDHPRFGVILSVWPEEEEEG